MFLPDSLRAVADLTILLTISGYVLKLGVERMVRAAMESECMSVDSGLSCPTLQVRAASMAWSSARVMGVLSGSLPCRT